MNVEIRAKDRARQDLARYRQDDPDGVDQVIDSINLLARDPMPPGVLKMGDMFRMHSGRYRIHYKIIDGDPVVISVEQVGRVG